MDARRLVRLVLARASVALLAACAAITRGYPLSVRPGDAREDVERLAGAPTAVYTMPDGHLRWEYSHMPFGKQTFMVDFDATGHVAKWENVLDETHFEAIVPGLAREDVLRLIGPPTGTWHYRLPAPGITWRYRFVTIQRCVLFEVAYDEATGRVLDTAYPPDPACPDEWH